MRSASLATLAGLALHYLFFYATGVPLLTEAIAEWIMARTPSHLAVPLLQATGAWGKPLAMTGGLATLGFALHCSELSSRWRRWALGFTALCFVLAYSWLFEYRFVAGHLSFWVPALLSLPAGQAYFRRASLTQTTVSSVSAAVPSHSRRQALVMLGGTAAVAVESYARNEALARRAVPSEPLSPFPPLLDDRNSFGAGLVRPSVNQVGQFYVMSKNAVDPVIHPGSWRLRITQNGELLQEFSYARLLQLPRTGRFVTLRCISNTLKSDLMSTAHWSGIHLHQLLPRDRFERGIVEVAVIGADGHGDSFPLDYLFSDEPLLALGMQGRTLSRMHGFPLRLLAPRYYGFKHVKWIAEIALLTRPYFGTWPKLGYTKEPVVHTASHIDRYRSTSRALLVGGASFAGARGIQQVRVRPERGPWVDATVESPLSPYTLSRWYAELPAGPHRFLEAQARDGAGRWQATRETPLFPDGVDGPTLRSIA